MSLGSHFSPKKSTYFMQLRQARTRVSIYPRIYSPKKHMFCLHGQSIQHMTEENCQAPHYFHAIWQWHFNNDIHSIERPVSVDETCAREGT